MSVAYHQWYINDTLGNIAVKHKQLIYSKKENTAGDQEVCSK